MIGSFLALAVSAALVPAGPVADFRAGDAGFSLRTAAGETWLYGDSWQQGHFIRNAVALDGAYTGTIEGGGAVPAGDWIWPGAPFELPGGEVEMYANEIAGPAGGTGGPWSFRIAGGVRVQFDPSNPGAAKVQRMPPSSVIWSAATAEDPASGTRYVYGTDELQQAHVARVEPGGEVTELGILGGPIASQFSVLQDPLDGSWWMVGNLPLLSRRIVAYQLSGPAGRVLSPALTLMTLPDPGPQGYAYAATVHPELNGLLTWAVNSTRSGAAYGLMRQAGFWPAALRFAHAGS